MAKRYLLAVVAVFIAWSAMDFLIHGVILKAAYEETASLWRPMLEMKMALMYGVVFVAALAFVGLYAAMGLPKSIAAGFKFGFLFGIAAGLPMGFGSYSVMPIPVDMATVWFVGSLAEAIAGGVIAASIFKSCYIGKCCCS